MNVETVELFTALLAVIALLGSLLYLLARVFARSVPAAMQAGREVQRIALWLAFTVAAVATAGSLYFSEVEHFVPCRMCWFQRIFMYPLAIVLLVAAIRKDRAVKYTAVPLAGIGACISVYHIGLERGWWTEGSSCDPLVPCSAPWFEQWGFVTLAVMALFGFVSIIILTTVGFPDDPDLLETPGDD